MAIKESKEVDTQDAQAGTKNVGKTGKGRWEDGTGVESTG